MRKTCVCLGSGGGYPKNHGEVDLYTIFDGNRDFNWGDIGTTYIVVKQWSW